MANNNSLKQS